MIKITKLQTIMITAVLACVLLSSCNATPTIPVPPPEMTLITVSIPDADGWVNLSGEANAVPYESTVLVFNDDTGDVKGDDAKDNGSFEINIQAELGHILIIQVKMGQKLSEEKELSVE